eukprot:s2251_g6.t4
MPAASATVTCPSRQSWGCVPMAVSVLQEHSARQCTISIPVSCPRNSYSIPAPGLEIPEVPEPTTANLRFGIGSSGHPHFCARPCLHISKDGVCPSGTACAYCHFPHRAISKPDSQLRKRLLDAGDQELLATFLPFIFKKATMEGLIPHVDHLLELLNAEMHETQSKPIALGRFRPMRMNFMHKAFGGEQHAPATSTYPSRSKSYQEAAPSSGSHAWWNGTISHAVDELSLLSTTPLARATSWHGAETEEATASDIAQPGGFRREFVMRPDGYGTVGPVEASSPRGQLAQYASRPLVPELLRVQQGVEADDDLLGLDPRLVSPLLPFYKPMYLLTPAKELGVSDQSQLVVMILKGFLGASVLYLPRSFLNGGLALGALTLAVVCVLAIVCIRQLIDCADRVLIERTISSSRNQQTFMEDGIGPFGMPSYGDLAEAALGKPGRAVVDLSVAASQVGFCATYFVFVSANVAEVIGTLAGCRHVISQGSLCGLLALVWLPLAQIRRLKHLSTLNLLADLCIAFGLLLILTGALTHLATTTTVWNLLRWARFETYPLCLGTALFAFEGIGLVLPMYEGTDPALRKSFKDTLSWTLAILCAFFILFAAVAYLSFGSTTRTLVLFNLRVGGEKRIGSQLLFSAALFFGSLRRLHISIDAAACVKVGGGSNGLARQWHRGERKGRGPRRARRSGRREETQLARQNLEDLRWQREGGKCVVLHVRHCDPEHNGRRIMHKCSHISVDISLASDPSIAQVFDSSLCHATTSEPNHMQLRR